MNIRKLFGIETPLALSLVAWRKFNNNYRRNHPYIYLAEKIINTPGNVISSISNKIDDWHSYLHNRFIAKTHIVKLNLKKGNFHEVDEVLLHACFTILVDYVEIDLAYLEMAWGKDVKRSLLSRINPFKVYRYPQAGIRRLKWEMSQKYENEPGTSKEQVGKPTPQAMSAKKVLELYNWWKKVRPNRKDTQDLSGLTRVYARLEKKYGKDGIFADLSKKDEQALSLAARRDFAIENRYIKEDINKLKELIEVSPSMWC